MSNLAPVALPAPMPERDPKEMLSIRQLPDGRSEIRINNSSYSLLSLCKRKAHYALNRGLVSKQESEATLFGRAIHSALEVWYAAPRTSRRSSSAQCDDSVALMESGQEPLPHGRCVRCSAQAAFIRVADALRGLDPGSKRSVINGTAILDAYFDYYADDPFVILSDALGPIVERRMELVLAEESDCRIVFFGTCDAVLKNESSGHILMCDHKTTSSLGSDFTNRINPSAQFRGYMAAFRATWPQFDTRTFMVNGLQVLKTKQAFMRQFVEIDDGAIAEWREAMLDVTFDWWARTKMESPSYPLNGSDACTSYGGCQYLPICQIPEKLREGMIAAQYDTKGPQDAA